MDGTPTSIVVPRRSNQQTQYPVKFRDYALTTNVMTVIEPLNYDQAKDKEEWLSAMNEEYNSIMRNKTWGLVEFPKDKVPIDLNGCSNLSSKLMVVLTNLRQD